MDKRTEEITNSQLDIKLEQFIEEELEQFIKVEKLQALRKYLLKYGKQVHLMTYFFNYAMQFINKTQ